MNECEFSFLDEGKRIKQPVEHETKTTNVERMRGVQG